MSKARNIANNGGRGTTANRPSYAAIGDTYFDTTVGGLVVYGANGWNTVTATGAPFAPTIGTATLSGSIILVQALPS